MVRMQNGGIMNLETLTAAPGLLWSDVALRLGLAFMTGAIIGLERENHGRAAGLRTTVLVCVSATIAMVLSGCLFAESGNGGTWRPDPARLAAGILTGMGFLGAGVIMREGLVVRGVTTAAALWFTTILGLAYGAGHVALGLSGLTLAMLALFVLPYGERYIHKDWYGCVSVSLEMGGMEDNELKQRIEQFGIVIKAVELNYDLASRRRTLLCRIRYRNGDVFQLSERVVRSLAECPGVVEVKWA